MFKKRAHAEWRALPLAVSLSALACATPAVGQTADQAADQAPAAAAKRTDGKKPKVSSTKPTSSNATVNLVNLLVQQGVLKEEQAQALIKQAEDEAYVSRQAAKDATAKADDATKAATAAAAAAQSPGTRHVTYVPEVVKRQLREEIKQEVMAKAQKENWASPGTYPEWAQRIRFYGDARVRYQGSYFPTGNDQADAINFNAINTGSPYNISSGNKTWWPTYDTSQDRNQFRFRGRLGMDADLLYGFTAGLRIATGENNSPVSTNETLGGGGGNFAKSGIWLDRGYINWQGWSGDLSLSAGRFDNPFWSPTDLVWYRDLGFDGFAVQAKHEVWEGFTPFAVAGAFPLYNTDFNAGSNLPVNPSDLNSPPSKFPSHDKWLFGGQVGFNARFSPEYAFRFGVAYYDFDNVQGQLSSPCIVELSSDVCDTDLTRPSFAQKGNTYTILRNIVPTVANNFGQDNQFQYFGLVGQYRPVVVSAQLDLGHFHPTHIVLDGEYVNNTAFSRSLMNAAAVNNRGPSLDGGTTPGPFNGGNQGWLGRVTVGDKEIRHLWDWNVHAGYKYLESDATIDAFADSDFGLGGTNLKGYFVGGNVGLGENVWASLRWMSANNIAGVPYAVDVLQVDLNAKF